MYDMTDIDTEPMPAEMRRIVTHWGLDPDAPKTKRMAYALYNLGYDDGETIENMRCILAHGKEQD